jgi:hypothetical protein
MSGQPISKTLLAKRQFEGTRVQHEFNRFASDPGPCTQLADEERKGKLLDFGEGKPWIPAQEQMRKTRGRQCISQLCRCHPDSTSNHIQIPLSPHQVFPWLGRKGRARHS